MPFKDVQEYQQSMDAYFRKFDARAYGETLAEMQDEMRELKSIDERKADQDKRLEQFEKTITNLTKKDLSPSGGVTVGVPVRMNDGSLQVVYLATDDARGRGLRLSFNGTAEKNESFHACRTRELQEELHHHQFFYAIFQNLAEANIQEHVVFEQNQATMECLKKCKFMYVSQQAVFIDSSTIYTEVELQKGLVEVNESMAFLQTLVKHFIDFKFAKVPTEDQVLAVQDALSAIIAYELFLPFTKKERENLRQLSQELKEFNQDNFKHCCQLIENTVMRYTEARGITPTPAAELQKRIGADEKASGIFGPNYEMFKSLYEDSNLKAYERR